jgi:hypothetical protein
MTTKPYLPPPFLLRGLLAGRVKQVSEPFPKRDQPTFSREGMFGPMYCWREFEGVPEMLSVLVERAIRVKPGDVLAVKETWAPYDSDGYEDVSIAYRASYDENAHGSARMQGAVCDFSIDSETAAKFEDIIDQFEACGERWFSPVTLPAKMCRLHLRVLSVRAQRCVDVTDEDAIAEGVVAVDIPPDENGPWRIGYMMGPDDGKTGLLVHPQDALAEAWQPYYARRGLEWATAWRWVAEVERVDQGKDGAK